MLLPKIIVAICLLLMALFIPNPANFAASYIILRPIVQPYATAKLMLVASIPLTATLPLFFICYSGFICIFRRNYKLLAPNIIPLYAFLFFSILSFLNTTDYMLSLGHYLKVITAVLMYLLIYNSIKSRGDAKKILYGFMLASIVPMLYGYYQDLTGSAALFSNVPGTLPRVPSFLGWNEYGIFLCILISCNLMLLMQETKKRNKVFLIILLCLMVISSILALNRGSWIAYSAALIIAYIPYRDKIKVRWLAISGVLIAILFSDKIIARFMELGQVTSWGMSENTLLGRYELWKKLVSLVLVHPITGFGLGTARLVSYKYFKIYHVPHNDYLTITLELGVICLFLYIYFLSKIFIQNVRLISDKANWFINYPMLVLIIYWCILSFTQNMIYNMVTFPMFFAVVALSSKINELSHTD